MSDEQESSDGSDRETPTDHPHPQTRRTAGHPAGTATGEGTSEGAVGLEVVEDDMPILAHRYARVAVAPSGLTFSSITGKGTFGVDADAECLAENLPSRFYEPGGPLYGLPLLPQNHRAPHPLCTCGFYAAPADLLHRCVEDGDRLALLVVELSGDVLECDYGYRAEHQRVLQVSPPRCSCGEPAMKAWTNTAVGNGSTLVWDCGCWHIHPSFPTAELSFDEIAGLLGVPVVTR